jgi:hypothetical protein
MKIERRTVKDGLIQITTEDERWYFREADGKYFKSSSWVADYVHKGKAFTEWLKRVGQDADTIMSDRGDIGNKCHQAIHLLVHRRATEGRGYLDIENEVFMSESDGLHSRLTGEECEIVYSFVKWWEGLEAKYKIKVIDYEVSDFSDEYDFAGTRDLRLALEIREAIIPNPKRKTPEEDFTGTWLIDYKISKAIYLNHIAQISSYKKLPGCDGDRLAILQLGYRLNKAGFKFTEVEGRFDLWLAALVFWREENENKAPKQFELPQRLQL